VRHGRKKMGVEGEKSVIYIFFSIACSPVLQQIWQEDKSVQYICSFCLVSWGGVRLSPLGTSANIWPTVPAADDRWWVWSSRWNENWQGKPKYSEKTCPSATCSTTNPTWPDLGSNPGRRGGKLATSRLRYGTALYICFTLTRWNVNRFIFILVQVLSVSRATLLSQTRFIKSKITWNLVT
jgi:hypothetical protein